MYKIHPENFQKRPTAEQKKVWCILEDSASLLGHPFGDPPTTRIEMHLKIREMLAWESGRLKSVLVSWRTARKEAREVRRQHAVAG